MELTKQHRQALLSELDKANEDLIIQKKCHRDSQNKKDDLSKCFEIGVFLAEQKILLIKTSLMNNEIDY